MKTNEFSRITLIACVALISMTTIGAQETATNIIRKVDEKDKSSSSKMEFTMSIHPSDGSKARNFSLLAWENESDDSLIEFSAPKTVKGLRILSRGNNSWVFFPSTGRVRKIGSSSRSGSVQGVGGDFSYDDLGGGAWEEDYDFVKLGETEAFWELEGKRKTADAAYDAVKLTVDRATFLVTRAIFSLSSEGGNYKELALSEFRDFGGRLRAAKMVMTNMKKGSSTEVTLNAAQFDIRIEDRLFDPARINQ